MIKKLVLSTRQIYSYNSVISLLKIPKRKAYKILELIRVATTYNNINLMSQIGFSGRSNLERNGGEAGLKRGK